MNNIETITDNKKKKKKKREDESETNDDYGDGWVPPFAIQLVPSVNRDLTAAKVLYTHVYVRLHLYDRWRITIAPNFDPQESTNSQQSDISSGRPL